MIQFRRILHLRLRPTTAQLPALSKSAFTRNASTTTQQQNASGQTSLWMRRLIYSGIFGTLGLGAGEWMDSKISTPPIPGSLEDQKELREIQRVYDIGLPIVQELRSNPDYIESDVYQNYEDESNKHRLTSGPLAGSRGLGLQRIFWNDKEKKLVSVVFLGRGIEGWPTMVHGGALSTVIDENLGRAAIRSFPARTGVTANLNINYRAPVYSDAFYTLHTALDQERSTDRKAHTKCELRDLSGRLCVEATGLFVVPRQLKLNRIGDRY